MAFHCLSIGSEINAKARRALALRRLFRCKAVCSRKATCQVSSEASHMASAYILDLFKLLKAP